MSWQYVFFFFKVCNLNLNFLRNFVHPYYTHSATLLHPYYTLITHPFFRCVITAGSYYTPLLHEGVISGESYHTPITPLTNILCVLLPPSFCLVNKISPPEICIVWFKKFLLLFFGFFSPRVHLLVVLLVVCARAGRAVQMKVLTILHGRI